MNALNQNFIPKGLRGRNRNAIPLSMATLRDLSDWIEGTLGGDAPRVNSLVKLVRREGLFSSGGRGRNATRMAPQDFATAIVCALTTAAPTKAAEEVRRILALRTFSVSVDPGDGGGFRDFSVWGESRKLPATDPDGNRMLPPELADCPATLGDALAMWAEHFAENPASGVMDWDEISLRIACAPQVELQLFNPDWQNHRWGTEEGDYRAYAWKLRFEAEGLNYDPMLRETVTKLSAHVLRALADLAGAADG
ncbi:hypothetical protein [Litorisediminicola beolgyonensis]|uniref:Uncharacterized protein n=1 Tax=Litorisediminicola beolgyonensis TaxID=1173614 RepID=A0ABW3ZEJ6_9RHOB